MLRDQIAESLKQALESNDKKKAATLRLICAAITDRDASAREQGKDGITDEEVMNLLRTMLDQRVVECQDCEEKGETEQADLEREEMDMIRTFLPAQLSDYEIKLVCNNIVQSVNATGLRDMGKCMNELKARYPGQMDFVKASCMVKKLLQAPS
ncbi:GatB/YqeY domain-containing protein [Rhodobacteraceae bacterium RKSG542]|uniref:GatB/YqeY domain-containing protein n=1 Tax=Pseudovibrio flavus TaxID=2529854 RepID=UPI0012BD7E49|nr:GatB/YqeY domain-containing protein [Pseudovibrio flavus]MTI19082.1 GatB/YqeY domain-containing protein [Pseudovibrio flavus]